MGLQLSRQIVSSVASSGHSVLKFMLYAGGGVFDSIGLGKGNDKIQDAHYEATLECKAAALNTLRAASGSLTQLYNLQGALQLLTDNKAGREAAESLALNEMKHLDCSRLNLPDTVLSELKASEAAYEKVIGLCSEQKANIQRGKIIACVSTIGLIALKKIGCTSTTRFPLEAVVQVGLIVGGTTTLICISSVLAKQVMDLCNLMKALEKQRELLKETHTQAGGLIVTMGELQVQVLTLQEASESAGCAQRLRDMAAADDLDNQISDLTALKTSARQLTENAIQEFDLFKGKNGVITRRVVSEDKMNKPRPA